MPDKDGYFSKEEAAAEIRVSSEFIDRAISEVGIILPKKYKPAKFKREGEIRLDDYLLDLVMRVKVLRKLNFSFSQIKTIWNMEKDLIKLRDSIFKKRNTSKSKRLSLIVHPEIIYALNLGKSVKKTSNDYKYSELIEDYRALAFKVHDKCDKYFVDVKQVQSVLREVVVWFA